MNILITGAKGFVGRNLVSELKNIRDGKAKTYALPADLAIFEYDIDTDPALLDGYCRQADFVFHLAGVNRPKDPAEFMSGNFGFTSTLLNTLKKHGSKAPILLSSSIQAMLDNPYGQSKKAGEELLFSYGRDNQVPVLVYRFPNLFGKWCRPNYNSVIATFCNNIAHNQPIQINDSEVELTLVYIDDLVRELIAAAEGHPNLAKDGYGYVDTVHVEKLGHIAELIRSFAASRQDRSVPDMGDPFTKKLYATYLSYLPTDGFAYPLDMHCDARGNFTEILRTADRGQFSVNISKPGITKGNHWHHTKNEKFVVVHGHGLIQLRREGTDADGKPFPVQNYEVSGDRIQAVDMIPGYTHNIINLSDTEDLVTFMWANECFDPERPDTFSDVVEER